MNKKTLPPEVLDFFRKEGAKGGKLSGKARMEKLTPEQRSEIAKNAVAAREAKRSKKAPSPTGARKQVRRQKAAV